MTNSPPWQDCRLLKKTHDAREADCPTASRVRKSTLFLETSNQSAIDDGDSIAMTTVASVSGKSEEDSEHALAKGVDGEEKWTDWHHSFRGSYPVVLRTARALSTGGVIVSGPEERHSARRPDTSNYVHGEQRQTMLGLAAQAHRAIPSVDRFRDDACESRSRIRALLDVPRMARATAPNQ